MLSCRRSVPIFALLASLLLGAAPSAAEAAGFGKRRASHKDCLRTERLLGKLEWAAARGRGRARGLERVIRRQARRYADHCVALNHLQVLGTHNSYHIQPDPFLINGYANFDPDAIFWEYTHQPLDVQLEAQGVRQIELDVYADPEGGLHAQPVGHGLLLGDLDARIPELEPPGMKVLHIADLDIFSTCPTLIDCLGVVKAWSDANPRHLPITIVIEAKSEGFLFIEPIPFGPAEFDDLDAEIRFVFPDAQLITPDHVRGGAATLEEAVLKRGWPTLAEARGRVLFALDNPGAERLDYLQGHPSLTGRVMFTSSSPGEPDAAFIQLHDPFGAPIAERVAEGYIVRTRTDSDTIEARANSTERRDEALRSGAQFVSTDYPAPDPLFSDYSVQIPGGMPGRCNPVYAPPGCRDFALEPGGW
jgi:hypothetical protein